MPLSQTISGLLHALCFRWMTVLAVGGAANFSVFGFGNIPMYLTPFASLILTSIIIPRASFVGHLSGILVGFLVCPCILHSPMQASHEAPAQVLGLLLMKGWIPNTKGNTFWM